MLPLGMQPASSKPRLASVSAQQMKHTQGPAIKAAAPDLPVCAARESRRCLQHWRLRNDRSDRMPE